MKTRNLSRQAGASLLALVLAVLVGCPPSFAEMETVAKVKTLDQMRLEKPSSIESQFESLTPQAIQLGLADAVLSGSVVTEKQPDKTTRVKINWNAIKSAKGGVTEPLESPLLSQFTTHENVDPGTQLNVKGDLDALARSYMALKEKMKKGSPTNVVESKETQKTNEVMREARDDNKGFTPSKGSDSPLPSSVSSDPGDFKASVVSTRYEDCSPRIDKTGGKVYTRAKAIQESDDGKTVSIGECQDRGEAVAIVKKYGDGCKDVVDFAGRKAYKPYNEYAMLDGQKIEVSNCVNDLTQFTPIEAAISGCGMRNDMIAGVTYQQEKLFYRDGATINYVSDCQDSATAFTHYLTADTCTPTVDTVSGTVKVNKRKAFALPDGSVQYAGECGPTTDPALSLSVYSAAVKEYGGKCEPVIDLEKKLIYTLYREYSMVNGKEYQITPCTNDFSKATPILTTTEGCNIRDDFAANKSIQQEKLYSMEGATKKFLTGCQDSTTVYPHYMTENTCSPMVNAIQEQVFIYKRPAYTKSNGTVEYVGECGPLETPIALRDYTPILKNFDSKVCAATVDTEARKIYEGYREYVEVNGKKYALTTGCITDMTKTRDILPTTEGCNVRDDFAANRSVQQEKLYYQDNSGALIYVSTCQDSATIYTHYPTESTCAPVYDPLKGIMIIYSRIAYAKTDGTTGYASECSASSGSGIAIKEEYCSPKYIHNFGTGQSYYNTRKYYVDSKGVVQYLTTCAQSTLSSFTHNRTTTGCSTTNNDAALLTTIQAKTTITTPEDGTFDIAACSTQSTIAYVRTTDKTATWEKTAAGTYTFTLPAVLGANTVYLDMSGAGGGGGGAQGGQTENEGDCSAIRGGGGGGSGYGTKNYTITTLAPNGSVTVTVGAGGGGGVGQNPFAWHTLPVIGNAGGASVFGAIYTGSGGSGGTIDLTNSTGGAYGGAAYTNGGNWASAGTIGGLRGTLSGYTLLLGLAPAGGGGGGASLFANGGKGGNMGTGGSVGAYGSGGGGGGATFGGTGGAGGKGGDGYCKVTYTTPQYIRGDGTTYAP